MTEVSCECHVLKDKGDVCERAEHTGGRRLSPTIELLIKKPQPFENLVGPCVTL